jgi:hypothetical protein
MQKFRTCFLILGVLLFCANAFGQSPSSTPVYVSGGPYIYNVLSNGTLVKVYDATLSTTTSDVGVLPGTKTTTKKYLGPYFSSLTVGPDNVDMDVNGNAKYPFLIYACDNNKNTIIRFAPTGAVTFTANPTVDVVYNSSSSPAITPVCGRFTSTGDFYVTNQSSASSTTATVYEFVGVANVGLGGLGGLRNPMPVELTGLSSASAASAGITQKNVGDLLLVDSTNNQVVRSPYVTTPVTPTPPFETASAFITSNLSSPLGIARISTGDVFVANAGLSPSTVTHFSSTGAPAPTCPALSFSGAGNTSLFFLAASETDIIYAAASQPTSSKDFTEDLDFTPEKDNPGQVWSWSPGQGNCTFVSVAKSETELSGVAVAPIPTAPIQQTLTATVASPTAATFSFNSNEFQIIAGGNCTATVTANQLSLANINSMISKAGLPNGGTPIVNLGEGGYEIAYEAKWPDSLSSPPCAPVLSDGLFGTFIFGLYDPNLSSNPEMIRCDDLNPSDEPNLDSGASCQALTLIGSYPLGGPIPNDNGLGAGGTKNSVFFLANANPNPNAAEQGQFCGFIPPNGTTFDTDDFVVVAFQLAQNTGTAVSPSFNCKTGPFIPNAQVLLSAAETATPTAPTFSAIVNLKTVGNQGTTFPKPGLCKFFPNSPFFCTYVLVFNLQANGLTPGTYELSADSMGNAGTEAVTITVVPESPNNPF